MTVNKHVEYEDIVEIISSIVGDLPEDHTHLYEEKLTGPKWKLKAEDLVFLVMELMKRYDIKFDPADFEDMKMNSVASIGRVINSKANG